MLRRRARRASGGVERVVAVEASALEQALRPLLLPLVGGAARLFLRVCNTTSVRAFWLRAVTAGARHSPTVAAQVLGEERLTDAVLHRAPGQGLLSVCNHVGALDDPLVLAAALPAAVLTQPEAMRWTMCAADRCFVNPFADAFFRAGKVLPLTRGLGLEQPGMAAAEARLASGQWVHIFPEGTRSQTGAMGPVRVGVGRLYAAALAEARLASPAAPAPLVLPFVHTGMADVNPRGTARLGFRKDVRVLVGEPLDLSPLVAGARERGSAPATLTCVAPAAFHACCACGLSRLLRLRRCADGSRSHVSQRTTSAATRRRCCTRRWLHEWRRRCCRCTRSSRARCRLRPPRLSCALRTWRAAGCKSWPAGALRRVSCGTCHSRGLQPLTPGPRGWRPHEGRSTYCAALERRTGA